MNVVDKKVLLDSWRNYLEDIKNKNDFDLDKKNRMEAIVINAIEFISWVPEEDIYMDYLLKKCNGLSDYAIAKVFGLISKRTVRADKLKKIIRKRHSELYKEFIRQYYDY